MSAHQLGSWNHKVWSKKAFFFWKTYPSKNIYNWLVVSTQLKNISQIEKTPKHLTDGEKVERNSMTDCKSACFVHLAFPLWRRSKSLVVLRAALPNWIGYDWLCLRCFPPQTRLSPFPFKYFTVISRGSKFSGTWWSKIPSMHWWPDYQVALKGAVSIAKLIPLTRRPSCCKPVLSGSRCQERNCKHGKGYS